MFASFHILYIQVNCPALLGQFFQVHKLKPVFVPVGVPVDEIPVFERSALLVAAAICKHLISLAQLVTYPLKIVLKGFFFPGYVVVAKRFHSV